MDAKNVNVPTVIYSYVDSKSSSDDVNELFWYVISDNVFFCSNTDTYISYSLSSEGKQEQVGTQFS